MSALLGKEFRSLDEITNEVANVDAGGDKAKFTSTPITLSGGLPANKIEVKGLDGQVGLVRVVTFKDNTAYTILLLSLRMAKSIMPYQTSKQWLTLFSQSNKYKSTIIIVSLVPNVYI